MFAEAAVCVQRVGLQYEDAEAGDAVISLSLPSLSALMITLWATEPDRVVKSKKKKIFFFDKIHYIYMGEGHFSPDPLGSSNFRASKQLKTAKNGLFEQFLTI